jgi:cell division protein FtsW (lipid II flippase)
MDSPGKTLEQTSGENLSNAKQKKSAIKSSCADYFSLFVDHFKRNEDYNVWTLQIRDEKTREEFFKYMYERDRPKMFIFIFIFIVHGVYLIPEFLKTKKNEMMWRVLTQLPLLILIIAAFIAKKHRHWFDVLINICHFMKGVAAIMLKAQMMKNKSEIKVSPTYLFP